MQHYFIEKVIFFLCCSTFLLEINSPCMYVSVLLVDFSISMPIPHCFNLCIKNKMLGILNLYLFIKPIKIKVKIISKLVQIYLISYGKLQSYILENYLNGNNLLQKYLNPLVGQSIKVLSLMQI